jgi:hypothetical protein
MAAPEYQTVFEIGLRSFPWSAFLNPSLCTLLGVALYRFSKRQFFKASGSVAILVGALFFLIAFISLIPKSIQLRSAYVKRQTTMVEGPVEDFHPMPTLGPSKESFSVGTVPFSYYVGEFTPCFTNTPEHRGPIRAGLTVRIFYNDVFNE